METLSPLSTNSPFCFPQLLATIILLSVSRNSTTVGTLYVQGPLILVFAAGLYHLAQRSSGFTVLRHVIESPSFLRLDNIPLCVYAAFCLCMHLLGHNGFIFPFCLLCIMLLKHGCPNTPNTGVLPFSSLGNILRRGITASDGHSTLKFLRYRHPVFSRATLSSFPSAIIKFPISLQPCHIWFFFRKIQFLKIETERKNSLSWLPTAMNSQLL